MRRVLKVLDEQTAELAKAPFFEFLGDTTIDPRRRLSFAPVVAHFVMTFADLYGLVLCEEPPRDEYQRLVNAHASEDENHWRWFIADLQKLAADPAIPFSQSLKFVWGPDTTQMRLLSYHMCRLGFEADTLQKLVLVHCIEAAGKVTVEPVAKVGAEFTAATGLPLVYFGQHHSDSESDHTLEEEQTQKMVEDIVIDDERVEQLISVVEQSFRYFRAFIDEMHAFALSDRSLPASVAEAC